MSPATTATLIALHWCDHRRDYNKKRLTITHNTQYRLVVRCRGTIPNKWYLNSWWLSRTHLFFSKKIELCVCCLSNVLDLLPPPPSTPYQRLLLSQFQWNMWHHSSCKRAEFHVFFSHFLPLSILSTNCTCVLLRLHIPYAWCVPRSTKHVFNFFRLGLFSPSKRPHRIGAWILWFWFWLTHAYTKIDTVLFWWRDFNK